MKRMIIKLPLKLYIFMERYIVCKKIQDREDYVKIG